MSTDCRYLSAKRNPRCAERTSAEFERRVTIAEFSGCIQYLEAS